MAGMSPAWRGTAAGSNGGSGVSGGLVLLADARRPRGGRRSFAEPRHILPADATDHDGTQISVIGLPGVDQKRAALLSGRLSDPGLGHLNCVQPIMPAAGTVAFSFASTAWRGLPIPSSRDRKETDLDIACSVRHFVLSTRAAKRGPWRTDTPTIDIELAEHQSFSKAEKSETQRCIQILICMRKS